MMMKSGLDRPGIKGSCTRSQTPEFHRSPSVQVFFFFFLFIYICPPFWGLGWGWGGNGTESWGIGAVIPSAFIVSVETKPEVVVYISAKSESVSYNSLINIDLTLLLFFCSFVL